MSHCQLINDNSALFNAQTDFALDILRQNGLNSSTIFSPISITFALAMVFLGAKENTATQIRNTITKGYNYEDDEIHCYFSSLMSSMKANNVIMKEPETQKKDKEEGDEDFNMDFTRKNEAFFLEFVNKVYIDDNFTPLDSFMNGIKNYYGGGIEKIDFYQKTKAAEKINEFVANVTHGKIQNFIDPSSLDPSNTALIIINIIYFKAYWQKTFSEKDTKEADFYSSPDVTQKVMMMSRTLQRGITEFENDEYQVVGIPYESDKATMYIILPHERFGLEKVIKYFDSSKLAEIFHSNRNGYVRVKIPRFKIESEFDMVETLKNLGITDAFKEETADFSGISNENKLKISNVMHKAFIETNENGTVATAVTGYSFEWCSGRVGKPKEFTADHPFMFIIADKKFNILFAGTHF